MYVCMSVFIHLYIYHARHQTGGDVRHRLYYMIDFSVEADRRQGLGVYFERIQANRSASNRTIQRESLCSNERDVDKCSTWRRYERRSNDSNPLSDIHLRALKGRFNGDKFVASRFRTRHIVLYTLCSRVNFVSWQPVTELSVIGRFVENRFDSSPAEKYVVCTRAAEWCTEAFETDTFLAKG